MYKKIEFAKILSSSIEDDTEDVNKESEIDLIDSLIKDVDLKKNYNSRYNFYINFIKMYQKDPNIIKYIYTKLNTIKNLNEKERDLLSKLSYTSSQKGGSNYKNTIIKTKIIELIKKIKIGKIKNNDIINNLRSDLKKIIINVYGDNINENNVDNIVYKLIKQKGGSKGETLKEIKSQVEELFKDDTKIGDTNIEKSTITRLIKDITNKLYSKYEEINELKDDMNGNIKPLIEEIRTLTQPTSRSSLSPTQQPPTLSPTQQPPTLSPTKPSIQQPPTLSPKQQPPTLSPTKPSTQPSTLSPIQLQTQPTTLSQIQAPSQQPPPRKESSNTPTSIFIPSSYTSSSYENKKEDNSNEKIVDAVSSSKSVDDKEYLKVIKVLQKHYELKNLSNFNNKNFSDDDDYLTEKKNTYDNPILQFNYDIDKYNNNIDDTDEKNSLKDIKKKLISFENNPSNPYLQLSISFEDRLVFIITTFFIRYISLILIQWCVDINIIRSFEEGFIYYAILYISIFWFFVLFVNIDNSFKIDYMNIGNALNSIRSLFYYFYMGTNGVTKLLVHSCLICVIIVIPVILNIKKKNDYIDADDIKEEKLISYEDRKKLSKSLSLFTIFLWILTSIIATKF
jgi:hypothetical protein